jgi:F0F1-type ATP synthase assembly protein I
MKNYDLQRWAKALGFFSVIVAEFVAWIGAGVLIGAYLLKYWGAPAWVLILTSVLGLVAAITRLMKIADRMNSQESSTENNSEESSGESPGKSRGRFKDERNF